MKNPLSAQKTKPQPAKQKIKQKIQELESRIQQAENYKKQIIKISQSKSLESSSIQKWINYYNNYINVCKTQIQNYKNQIKKQKIKILSLLLFIPLFFIILISSFIFFYPKEQVSLGPPVQIISSTDVWKYEDSNTDLPSTWITQSYDDSSWLSGPGKLGFGTNDGVFGTIVRDLNQVTFYYRKNFNIDDVSAIESMQINIDYDDCYAIYINGNLLSASSNFVNDAHGTVCSSVHNSAEDASGPTAPINPTIQFTPQQIAWLQNSPNNLIAVEIHQQSAASSDTVLSLTMQGTLFDTQPPTITINSPLDGSAIQDTTPLVDITTDEISTISYQINSEPVQILCTSCTSANFFLDLPEGQHTLTIFAEDIDLNTATQTSTFTIDLQSQFFDTYNDDSSVRNLNNLQFSPGSISLSSVPQQRTINLQGPPNIDDAEIRASTPTTNYGSLVSLNIDGQNPHSHAVIKFPTLIGTSANQIPPGSIIVSASLQIFCTDAGNNQIAYLLAEDWIESQVTWNSRSAGIPWTILGAESPPSRDSSFSITFTCPTANQLRTFDITQFVQRWANGNPNYGFVMIDTGNNGVDYSSSESANSPVLTVTYQEPVQNTGSFESTIINTLNIISSIDSISWTEAGTDANDIINIEIYDGSSWQPITNGASMQNFNSNVLAYRAFFTLQDTTTISLNDITISWTEQVTDTILPVISITSIASDTIFPYSISDNTPEILLTTDENSQCRASLTDESYDDMSNDIICSANGLSHSCQFTSPIPDSSSQSLHLACEDTAGNKHSTSNNLDTTVEIDTLPPLQSSHNPSLSSTINTNSPLITFNTNEIADCRSSLTDESYDNMADNFDCTGDGTTSHSCQLSGIPEGFVIIYISCQDDTEFSQNKDTPATNQHVDYTIFINDPPTIISIDTSFSPLSLLAGTTTDVLFTFTAQDLDGAANINDATATASFSKAGEAARSTPLCNFFFETPPNQRTYECTITMQYYDDNGDWDVTASVQDNAGTTAAQTSQFTINLLQDISLSPALINFPTLVQGQTNIQSSSTTIITNNGNFDSSDGFVSIIASNLVGESNPAEIIPASDFKAADSSQADVCAAGTTLAHSISTQIPSISLPRGPIGGNTEEISYCLTLVPAQISPQFYSATQTGGNPWAITLLAAPLPLLARRKKKKQQIKEKIKKEKQSQIKEKQTLSQENLLSILDEKLKDNYNITLNELLTKVKKLKEEQTQTTSTPALTIPISIFSQKTSAAESLCKYLKENKELKFSQIEKLINRNQRTIWINYRNAIKKNKNRIKISKEKQIQIPISVFADRRLSILESLIYYLKENQIKNIEIANLLNKDARNIHTFYSRALKKLNKKVK